MRDLYDKAMRFYPPGTKFMSPQNGKVYTVSAKNTYEVCSANGWIGHDTLLVRVDESESVGEFLLYKNEWARYSHGIPKAPEPEFEYYRLSQHCENNSPYDVIGIIGRVYRFSKLGGPHWGMKCNIKCGEYAPGSILYFFPAQFSPATEEDYLAQIGETKSFNTYSIY